MNRLHYLALLGFLQISVAAFAAGPGPTRPNVLLIIADDLNTRLGCYGDQAARTPGLDKLATQGVVFNRAYACGTVCTPSRKSFLTGLSVARTGHANENYMKDNPDAMTMARWFREHGYQTAKIGKVEHAPEFAGTKCWETVLLPGKAEKNKNLERRHLGVALQGVAPIFSDESLTQDQLREKGFEQFLRAQWDQTRPFFFALGFHSPHSPLETNKRYIDMHPLERMPLTVTPKNATPMSNGPDAKHTQPGYPDAAQRLHIQSYYAAVSMMDDQVAQAMKQLEELGLEENTVVVFFSDQGYFLGSRDLWSKHYSYPEVLRVPLIVRYPKLPKKGFKADGIVELLDLFPTLAELAGLPVPVGLDGASFVPLLKDPNAPGKPAAYARGIMYREETVTTREGMYQETAATPKIIPGKEFYDLRADPNGWFNLIDTPKYLPAIHEHTQLLKTYFPEEPQAAKK